MKNHMIHILLVILIGVWPISASGQPEKNKDMGKRFTGRVEFGILGISTSSKVMGMNEDDYLWLDKDFLQIDDLDEKASFETVATDCFLFDIHYLLTDTSSIYLGTPFFDDNREGLTAGYQKLLDNNSLIDASIFFGSEDVWEDPYLTGAERNITSMYNPGFAIDYDGIFGTGWQVNYKFRGNLPEKDKAGERDSRLKRNGNTQTFRSSYVFYLNKQFDKVFTPSIYYTFDNREGGAYRNNSYGLDLTYAMEMGNHALTLGGTAEIKQYDKVHPVFDKTRSDQVYSVELIYIKKHLWKTNWYTRMGCGVVRVNANIDFFNESSIIYGITLGYSFE